MRGIIVKIIILLYFINTVVYLAENYSKQNDIKYKINNVKILMKKKDFQQAENIIELLDKEYPENKQIKKIKQKIKYEQEKIQTKNNKIKYQDRRESWENTIDEIMQNPEVTTEKSNFNYPLKVTIENKNNIILEQNNILDELIGLDFSQTKLIDILKHLNEISGIDIVVNLQESAEEIITFQTGQEMPLKYILNNICEMTNTEWQIKMGAVVVKEKDQQNGKYYTVVYDVRDIAYPPEGAWPLRWRGLKLGVDEDADEDWDWEVEEKTRQDRKNNFAKLIKYVLTEKQKNNDVYIADSREGIITITTDKNGHEKVSLVMEKLRYGMSTQVAVAARFLRLQDNFWEVFDSQFTPANSSKATGIGIDNRRNGPGKDRFGEFSAGGWLGSRKPVAKETFLVPKINPGNNTGLNINLLNRGWLGKINANYMLRIMKEEKLADEVQGMSLVVANRKRATFQNKKTVQYAKDFNTIQREFNHIWLNEIITGELDEGMGLDMIVNISQDRKYITMRMLPKMVEADFVRDGFIELPQTREYNTEAHAVVPDGGTLLFSGMAIGINANPVSGVPGISRLPLLGKLFTRKGEQRSRVNYALMVTADILVLDDN